MAQHYVYGSGEAGCLYDNGPHECATKDEAIDALCETFNDLPPGYLEYMRKDLQTAGIHYFSNHQYDWSQFGLCHEDETVSAREVAGAAYCEVSGPFPGDPESNDE